MHHNCTSAIVVGAAVIQNGRILLLQRTEDDTFPGMWELPGGGRDCGETPDETLTRELREETGLQLKTAQLFSTFTYDMDEGDGRVTHAVQLNYRVTVAPGHPVRSNEHQADAFVGLDELHRYPTTPETRKVILEAFTA